MTHESNNRNPVDNLQLQRKKTANLDQFVTALQKNQIPVTYVVFPDEGHGFSKVQNRLTHYGHIEKFLHSCLGGEYEPFENQQYNSSAMVGKHM